MKEKRNNQQKEQGSVQRQTQKNESYKDIVGNNEGQNSDAEFGIIPALPIKKPYQKKSGKGQPDLKEINDEEIIPGIKTKRSYWNSVDFEADNLGGWMPI